jgi:predicted DsbA family dithiol-disulfide isomerase
MKQIRVDIYSDIVCPWCFIGKRRFAEAKAALPRDIEVHVVFRPFQLDPSTPAEPVALPLALEQKFGGRARQMIRQVTDVAAGEGLTFDFARAISVNTRTAHRLLGLAEREYSSEVQLALAERLFEAHFTLGQNVADLATLTDLAASVGMDRDRTRVYLDTGEGSDELDRDLASARGLGIRAVPTFVFDGSLAIEGAQPMTAFARVLAEITADSDERTAAA